VGPGILSDQPTGTVYVVHTEETDEPVSLIVAGPEEDQWDTFMPVGTTVPVNQDFGDVADDGPTVNPADRYSALVKHRHGMPANPVIAHEAASDPHPGYATDGDLSAHAATPHGGVSDHGGLTGLADDDHPAYPTMVSQAAQPADPVGDRPAIWYDTDDSPPEVISTPPALRKYMYDTFQ
jgi:hypothetical protein